MTIDVTRFQVEEEIDGERISVGKMTEKKLRMSNSDVEAWERLDE